MPYLGRRGALAPLTSADIPVGIVEGTDIAFLENASGTHNLEGTYSTERMYLNDSYTLTGNVTITGHLALGSIADEDIVITQDSTERTITGSGTLEAGNILQDTHSTSVTGMTGELANSVQDNITRLGTVTSGIFNGTLNTTTFSGSAGKITAKVWVTYKGTDAVAIHDSVGVSSVTDNGVGIYTVNFLTPFAKIYYFSVGMSGHNTTKLKSVSQPIGTTPPTTNSCKYETVYADGSIADAQIMMVAIFGD